MQNRGNKSKIDIRLSNPEHGTKPLKNRYIFHHRGLKYFSKLSCHRPTTVPPPGGGGWGRGGTQQIIMPGGSAPGSNPLPFYIPVLSEKVPLFVYYLLTNSTPFTCLV